MFREHGYEALLEHFEENSDDFAVAGPMVKGDRIVGSLLVIKALMKPRRAKSSKRYLILKLVCGSLSGLTNFSQGSVTGRMFPRHKAFKIVDPVVTRASKSI